MKNNYRKSFYNTRTWLNDLSSPSTGNVSCYDGLENIGSNDEWRNTFLSVSDCYQSARLHLLPEEDIQDFIKKLQLLQLEINKFITHLSNNKLSNSGSIEE